MKDIRENCDQSVVIAIVGNMTDLAEEQKISTEEGQKLADDLGAEFFETSASEDRNVSEVRNSLRNQVVRDNAAQSLQKPNCKIVILRKHQRFANSTAGNIRSDIRPELRKKRKKRVLLRTTLAFYSSYIHHFTYEKFSGLAWQTFLLLQKATRRALHLLPLSVQPKVMDARPDLAQVEIELDLPHGLRPRAVNQEGMHKRFFRAQAVGRVIGEDLL